MLGTRVDIVFPFCSCVEADEGLGHEGDEEGEECGVRPCSMPGGMGVGIWRFQSRLTGAELLLEIGISAAC